MATVQGINVSGVDSKLEDLLVSVNLDENGLLTTTDVGGNVTNVGNVGGGGGSGGLSKEFVFASAALVWTCAHNFNKATVVVQCYDPADVAIEGDIQIIDTNTVKITWYAATSGRCRILA